jgi:glycosyltransferase involved in cell wall biosynthesis
MAVSLRQRTGLVIEIILSKMETQCLKTKRILDIGFYRYSLLNRGGDRLILEYANFLAARGHTVTLYAREINTVFKIDPRVHVKKLPYPGRAGALLYGAARHFGHDSIIVDIIHLPFALSLSNKVLYYAQADDREYYGSRCLRSAIDMLYRWYFRSGRPIISMSHHLTDIFSRRYGTIHAHTLRTGIDHALFYPERDDGLSRQKDDRKAVVFMSRGDTYRKGFDIALKVFELLSTKLPDKIEVWVCGNPLDRRYAFPLRNFGILDDNHLRQMLSSADIFFYPSRHEGFGLFPLEAMACGCAVVTTDAIPYARTLPIMQCSPVDDVTGLADNIMRLVEDDTLLEYNKKRGILEAEQFDLEKTRTAFESALLDILSGRGR